MTIQRKTLGVGFAPEIYNKIKAMAAAEQRTFANMLQVLLSEALKARQAKK